VYRLHVRDLQHATIFLTTLYDHCCCRCGHCSRAHRSLMFDFDDLKDHRLAYRLRTFNAHVVHGNTAGIST